MHLVIPTRNARSEYSKYPCAPLRKAYPCNTPANQLLQTPTTRAKTRQNSRSTKQLDYSKVWVKVNGHPALALVDLQTTGRDLINAQFVHLYGLPTYGIDKKSLNTAIKGSKSMINKACDVQMDFGAYTETRTLYVAHLAGWEMILGRLALTALNPLIPAGPKPVTIQPEGMARFALLQ